MIRNALTKTEEDYKNFFKTIGTNEKENKKLVFLQKNYKKALLNLQISFDRINLKYTNPYFIPLYDNIVLDDNTNLYPILLKNNITLDTIKDTSDNTCYIKVSPRYKTPIFVITDYIPIIKGIVINEYIYGLVDKNPIVKSNSYIIPYFLSNLDDFTIIDLKGKVVQKNNFAIMQAVKEKYNSVSFNKIMGIIFNIKDMDEIHIDYSYLRSLKNIEQLKLCLNLKIHKEELKLFTKYHIQNKKELCDVLGISLEDLDILINNNLLSSYLKDLINYNASDYKYWEEYKESSTILKTAIGSVHNYITFVNNIELWKENLKYMDINIRGTSTSFRTEIISTYLRFLKFNINMSFYEYYNYILQTSINQGDNDIFNISKNWNSIIATILPTDYKSIIINNIKFKDRINFYFRHLTLSDSISTVNSNLTIEHRNKNRMSILLSNIKEYYDNLEDVIKIETVEEEIANGYKRLKINNIYVLLQTLKALSVRLTYNIINDIYTNTNAYSILIKDNIIIGYGKKEGDEILYYSYYNEDITDKIYNEE